MSATRKSCCPKVLARERPSPGPAPTIANVFTEKKGPFSHRLCKIDSFWVSGCEVLTVRWPGRHRCLSDGAGISLCPGRSRSGGTAYRTCELTRLELARSPLDRLQCLPAPPRENPILFL